MVFIGYKPTTMGIWWRSDWWFGTWNFMTFHSVGNGTIIPTDFRIFCRGVGIPPTSLLEGKHHGMFDWLRWLSLCNNYWNIYEPDLEQLSEPKHTGYLRLGMMSENGQHLYCLLVLKIGPPIPLFFQLVQCIWCFLIVLWMVIEKQ